MRSFLVGKKLLLVAGSTLAALLLAECLVATFSPPPPVKVFQLTADDCVYERSQNPLLGFELKRNYQDDTPDFIRSYERTNSHGQRDRPRDPAKGDMPRILLLGDSVVEGYGLREAETISFQWEKIAGGSVEVLNFGVSAYCTRAEVELLETKGLAFDPDVVVLLFVENDFDNFNREAFALPAGTWRPPGVPWLFAHSACFRHIALGWNLFSYRAQTQPAEWNAEAIGNNNVAAGFARFRELADAAGFLPLVAIWPHFGDTAVEDKHFVADTQVLIAEALANQFELPSVRLSRPFREVGETNPKRAFSQGDGLHPNPRGAQLAAGNLHRIFAEGIEKLSPGPAPSTDKVAEALQELSQDRPNYARVYTQTGGDHFKAGDFAAARRAFEQALEEDPRHAPAHNNLGITLENLGAADLAETHFRQAIACQAGFAEAHTNLGRLLAKAGKQEAEQHLIAAVQAKPDLVAAHYQLSLWLIQTKRPTAGVHGLREVIRLDHTHVGALQALGKQLVLQQAFAEARSCFERVIKLHPQHADALNNLGATCVQQGDLPAARTAFEQALVAEPAHAKAAANLKRLIELDTARED